jgi:hypothetical protein
MSEVKTQRLFQSWLWKQTKLGYFTSFFQLFRSSILILIFFSRPLSLWVRRYYVLVRREQLDEMVSSSSDILHELCTFDSPSEHSECLSSMQLEEAIDFEEGPDCGLAAHEKQAAIEAREEGRLLGLKSKGSMGMGDNKRTLFSGLAEMFPIKFSTEQCADFTIQLNFPNRTLRLRAESKTMFERWRNLLKQIVPSTRIAVSHEGWLWRKVGSSWEQRYAVIFQGVLMFFADHDVCEKFKHIASRGGDTMFVAAPLMEGVTLQIRNFCIHLCSYLHFFISAAISLELCESELHVVVDDKNNVISLEIEEPYLSERILAVDEAQALAWLQSLRNGRQFWEGIADDHPSRKLFGGVGGEEDGPMLSQNANPLANKYGDDVEAKARAEKAAEAARESEAKKLAQKLARKQERARLRAERGKSKDHGDSPQRSNSNGSDSSGRSGGSKKSGKSAKSGKSDSSKSSVTGNNGMSVASRSLIKRALGASKHSDSPSSSPSSSPARRGSLSASPVPSLNLGASPLRSH